MLTPPVPEDVEVWTVPLDTAPGPAPPVLGALLDDEERARARRLPDPIRRSRFVTAHAALRTVVGSRVGRPPEAVRFTRGPNGKPEPAYGNGLFVSLSHSHGIALVALAARPVGVDVELPAGASVATRIAERCFPPDEFRAVAAAPAGRGPDGRAAVFARLWTRKEACVKAEGGRLGQGLGLWVLGGPGPLTVHGRGGALTGPWRVADLAPAPGYAGAVALSGSGPFRVVSRCWQPPVGVGGGEKSTTIMELSPAIT
ncbi:4'-phosphopantetheinyl transferase family protein [Kitasatospora sp. NPDC096204]|uniref:4'-phosphopantetheinyl transferase family protein n=1 Tax=Kitasatospora sp. NPDC096204 TaxID=3364094 RepID=UPI0038301B9E